MLRHETERHKRPAFALTTHVVIAKHPTLPVLIHAEGMLKNMQLARFHAAAFRLDRVFRFATASAASRSRFLRHRSVTAWRAASEHPGPPSFSARALPPFLPSATACGSLRLCGIVQCYGTPFDTYRQEKS